MTPRSDFGNILHEVIRDIDTWLENVICCGRTQNAREPSVCFRVFLRQIPSLCLPPEMKKRRRFSATAVFFT